MFCGNEGHSLVGNTPSMVGGRRAHGVGQLHLAISLTLSACSESIQRLQVVS